MRRGWESDWERVRPKKHRKWEKNKLIRRIARDLFKISWHLNPLENSNLGSFQKY